MFMARKPLGLLITVSSKPFAGFNAFSKKHRRKLCLRASAKNHYADSSLMSRLGI